MIKIPPAQEFVLRVGEGASVRRGFVFTASCHVIYAGMPSDSTYSVVVVKEHGNQASAYNLYLPRSQREVALPYGRLIVTSVSEDEMRWRLQRM